MRFGGETAWLSLNQKAELHRDSVVAEFAPAAADGKTYQVEHFNLDDFLRLSERDILTHAGTASHEDTEGEVKKVDKR